RSDVYSLGVLLYELLTGTTPFDRATLREAGFDEIRRIIREEEPPRPSDRVSTVEAASRSTISEQRGIDPRKLTHTLRGDLDWIVMRALEKDRTRRYETASALAADVSRHLTDEPIEACPPSQVYRFRKFARRNKTLLGAGTAVVLALLVGAGISSWQAYRATEAESEARHQQGRAEENLRLALDAVDQIYLEFVDERSPTFRIDGADPQKPITPEGEKFLRKAMEFYEKFAEANRHSPLARHEAAKAYDRVGKIRQRLKMYREAVAVCSQAIDIAEQLVAESPAVSEYRETLAAAYCTRGDCCQETGELDKSITDLSEAIRLRPEDVGAHLIRSVTYGQHGEFQKAIADCSKVMELDPKCVQAYINRGDSYRQIGNLDQAIADASEAIRLNPRDAIGYHVRSMAYCDKGEYDKAIADCSETLRLNPNVPAVYFNRGYIYWLQKQYDLALADYNKALELEPEEADQYFKLHFHRGQLYLQQKQYDLALADYNKALELDPGSAVTYNDRGVCYYEQKKYDLALADYKKALELEPDLVCAYNNRGQVCSKQKKYDLALADFNKALELDPDCAAAYNNRGVVYFKQNKTDLALADFNKALELDPDFACAYSGCGTVYCKQRQYDLALAEHNKALEVDRNADGVRHNFALFLLNCPDRDLRDTGRALELATEAVEADPENASAWSVLGQAHYRGGDFPQAVEALEKASKLDYKRKARNWFFLAMAHGKLGEKEEARRYYDRAVQWMAENQSPGAAFPISQFHDEAAEVLGIKEQ
ncbi:MAG: tetratricopeptide repeat protein, partial [Candidatus Nealsonbacteria bacterium]|nr:tetratricopeptide repeat protein [Candidatus Nealsonbacteria bacterium]